MRRRLVLVLLLVGGFAVDHGSELTPAVERAVADGAPGALVLVRDGDRVETAAAGLADVGARRELRASDRFRVGRITKTFVATVVLQLAAERRLRLDDPVDRWVPELLPDGDRITIRDLLSHRSGLRDVADEPAVLDGSRASWSPRRLVAFAARQPRTARPGTAFVYSNTNYVLLGLVVERVTGHGIASELDRRILRPLRLTATTLTPGRISGEHVHGYSLPSHQGLVDPGGTLRDVEPRSVHWAGASGGVVSSASDVARFLAALLGGKLLPPAQLQAMERVRPRYGLGLATYRTPCGRAWGHTGNLNGVVSVAWSGHDGRRQAVAMANAYPLPRAAEVALRRAAVTAFCSA